MSKQSLEQFMNQVAESEELQARIGEEIGADALIALGADHGCEFTVEDLRAAAATEMPGELSDEQLEAVAGGFTISSAVFLKGPEGLRGSVTVNF